MEIVEEGERTEQRKGSWGGWRSKNQVPLEKQSETGRREGKNSRTVTNYFFICQVYEFPAKLLS